MPARSPAPPASCLPGSLLSVCQCGPLSSRLPGQGRDTSVCFSFAALHACSCPRPARSPAPPSHNYARAHTPIDVGLHLSVLGCFLVLACMSVTLHPCHCVAQAVCLVAQRTGVVHAGCLKLKNPKSGKQLAFRPRWLIVDCSQRLVHCCSAGWAQRSSVPALMARRVPRPAQLMLCSAPEFCRLNHSLLLRPCLQVHA